MDGKPESLLRCNYIMRGVYLTPGRHRVEFRFQPQQTAFYISLTGLALGVILCGYMVVMNNSPKPSGTPANARPKKN